MGTLKYDCDVTTPAQPHRHSYFALEPGHETWSMAQHTDGLLVGLVKKFYVGILAAYWSSWKQMLFLIMPHVKLDW